MYFDKWCHLIKKTLDFFIGMCIMEKASDEANCCPFDMLVWVWPRMVYETRRSPDSLSLSRLMVSPKLESGVLSGTQSKLRATVVGSLRNSQIPPKWGMGHAVATVLFSIPVHHSIIFYFGRPDVFIWVSIGHLLIIGGLGYVMISNYGVIGASITVLIGTIFNFLYPLTWLIIKLKKWKFG